MILILYCQTYNPTLIFNWQFNLNHECTVSLFGKQLIRANTGIKVYRE